MRNGSTESRTTPNLRAMSSAALRLVPSASMNVVGRVMNGSVSFEAIQTKRGESTSVSAIRPFLTKCQRSTESAVAQPTQEPVEPWSATFHQAERRSFEAGIGGAAITMSASWAVSKVQSSSVFGEGLTLRIRFGCRLRDAFRRVVLRGLATGYLLGWDGRGAPSLRLRRA